jgi:uncharacterized protein YjiK
MPLRSHIILWFGVPLALSLEGSRGVEQAPESALARYALDRPASQWRLSRRLREISGLATTHDGRLLAHDDETAIVYEIDADDGGLVKAFALGDVPAVGDFEGIAVADDRIFLVTSSGRLYETREGDDDDRMLYNTYGTGVGRSCEVEGLAHEPSDRTLLLLCKTPRRKRYDDFIVIFKWSLDRRSLAPDSVIAIPRQAITSRIDGKAFRPSGIERHPDTGTYVIVAAAQEALAEVTRDGDVLDVRELSRKLHQQAEGITFSRDGALVIADEGEGRRARLTMYRPNRRLTPPRP